MTFTYDESALSAELNKIRLYIGDTDSNDPLLHDEEIALVQSDFTSFNKRCAECCKLICAQIIRRVDGRLGNLTEKSSVLYDRYEKLATEFDRRSSSSYPWAGGIVQSDKDDIEDDNALVDPKFKKGIMDNDT